MEALEMVDNRIAILAELKNQFIRSNLLENHRFGQDYRS